MAQHPYLPADLELPGWAPPVVQYQTILGVFFVAMAVITGMGLTLSGNRKHLGAADRAMLCWFLCCGIIHFFIEGSVVAFPRFYTDASGNFFFDLWKEYAKADSRYASRDDFVISMEAVTAFLEGPGCFAIVWAMLARAPWRHSAVVLVSLGQLYGDVLYFMTCLHGGVERHSRPEWLYFWFYFVIINSIWIVVPLVCIWRATSAINAAVATVEGQGAKAKKTK